MDPMQAEMAEGFKKTQEFTRKFAAAGGKVLAGSATGGPFAPGLGLFFEMQSLVDAGLTPMQAILGATKWAAEHLHKEAELGTPRCDLYTSFHRCLGYAQPANELARLR